MQRLTKWLAPTIPLILFGIVAAAPSRLDASGDVGDVKYSVYPPPVFQKKYGSSWVIANGQQLESDAALCNDDLLKICRVPDARGRFIRGMSVGPQAVGEGDPDTTRRVAEFQSDQFANHVHELAITKAESGEREGTTAPLGWSNEVRMLAGIKNNRTDWTGAGAIGNGAQVIKSAGAAETRPRNIALYVYIKVNP